MSSLAAEAAEAAAEPTTFLQVTQIVDLVVILVGIVVLARRRSTQPAAATDWALAMFAVLGSVVLVGFFEVEDDGSLLRHGYTVVLICVLLLVPYMLVRFAYALGAVSARVHQIAVVATVAELACTVVSPPSPEAGEPGSGWFTAYIILVIGGWTVQSVLAAYGLWSAGNGQPSVVRLRMRTLATGAVVIALTLVASGGAGESSSAVQVITTLMGVAGISMLVLAFVVPAWLRAAWRAADLEELGKTERLLMTAVTPDEVADAIVPAVIRLFGARGAAVFDGDGEVISSAGLGPDSRARLSGHLAQVVDPGQWSVLTGTGFASRLTAGWVVVEGGNFAPVFGAAELSLLERVASFSSLAIERSRLFEEEAASRRAAQAANAELQTLLYSVSHDLRNPILSVLGYLDVLGEEHAGQLQGEGERYLERISVNAVYMQNLIQDLLELSRIGRSEPASQPVPVGDLTESVAQEMRVLHPHCDVSVSGIFPTLWMSELRARQLLTNLLDNAAKHSAGEAQVTVTAERGEAGGATVLISDNGKGIPERHRQKVFEVFERLEANTDVPGTGMGLPICKRIVESIGGTITLDGPRSGAPSGTTVRVTLPGSVVRAWTPSQHTQKEHA